jgi:hypothetical protein
MSTVTFEGAKPASASRRRRTAPLRNGEHISRAEFERRWEATPTLTCVELIEGIVWIDLRALLDEQSDRVQKVLERGLKSVEHAALVKRLAAAK